MARRLAANIVARDPETGQVRTFLAGSTVPAWAAERITNPDVWASDVPDAGEVPAGDAMRAKVEGLIGDGDPSPEALEEATEKIELYSDLLDDLNETDPELDDGPERLERRPPEGGKGSGRDAWAAYAAQEGVDVDDEMTREDIIDAVDDAERHGS